MPFYNQLNLHRIDLARPIARFNGHTLPKIIIWPFLKIYSLFVKKHPVEKFERFIATHLLDNRRYNMVHHCVAGVLVVLMGQGLIILCSYAESKIINFFTDIVGWFFHGLGSIPFIKIFEKEA